MTVVDRDVPGAGATGAAFAWLTNQTCFRNGESLSDGSSRHYFGLHRLALGAWRRLHAELGEQLGVRWCGTVQLAPAGPDRELLEDDLRRRLQWGSPSYRIDAAQARRLLPGAVISDELAGFRTPDEGSVDPNLALAALVRAGAELGVQYRPCTEVLAIEGDHVATSRGSLACDDVVVTCGADSAAVLAGTGISVELVESAGSIVHLAPRRRFLDPVLLSSDVHAIQRSDGRTVIAKHYTGTPVGDPAGLDSEKLLADTTAVLPALAGAEIEKTTVGRRIVPADGLPVIGHSATRPNVHSITTNAGITLGPVLAQLLSTEIIDDVRIDVLDPYRSTRFDQASDQGGS